ncbi:glycosyltransferase family 4 protein [Actinoplanes sp. NEAU-A12]|uniref:Glycosyltransferase family 4 protein n=1 Tax=Actinoplanes sandaracinus TaxID=3045177 RepID=A0ABT6WPQ2_9ACTN|nr:glycosyltransferase family 4 protein [Actinoplanes sandaracinus]MDI6101733.1 glycosyltransferase family 4 protein [Actinoplanes sandaracinus]
MRLIVGLHHLELGGSQLNALDLAVSMRDYGHEVAVFGNYTDRPGPMADLVRAAGLPLISERHSAVRLGKTMPARPALSRAIGRAAREFRADLLHVYEFSVGLDAFYGAHVRRGLPVVTTIYGMRVPRWMPRYGEIIVGTQQLVDEAAGFRARPTLIEPPVNTDSDDPAAVDGRAFRARHGVGDDEIMIGVVSRLEPDMKAEGILRTIRAVGLLDDPRVRFVVVGDGPSFADVSAEADRVNTALGRPAVVMAGAMEDPRPAYAGADLMVGMGGSALRAMAFAQPLVVLGIRGFFLPAGPDTIDHFLREGFYGIGEGDVDAAPLAAALRTLVDDPALRAERGRWGRRLILDRFSLKAAAKTLNEVYERALANPVRPSRRLSEGARVAGHKAVADLLSDSARRRVRRFLG